MTKDIHIAGSWTCPCFERDFPPFLADLNPFMIYFDCFHMSVTQPLLAQLTERANFNSAPLLQLNALGFQFFFLSPNWVSVKSTVMMFFTASMLIISPSCMKAIGPPTCASGDMCPIINPWIL